MRIIHDFEYFNRRNVMNPGLFETLGKWAGIGGFALGVFLILFRGLISGTVLSKLKKEDAYRYLRLISLLVWSVAILGIVSYWWIKTHPDTLTTVSPSQPQTNVHVTNGVGAGGNVTTGDIDIGGGHEDTQKQPEKPHVPQPPPAPSQPSEAKPSQVNVTADHGVAAGGNVNAGNITIGNEEKDTSK